MGLSKKIAKVLFEFLEKRKGLKEYFSFPKKFMKTYEEIREWTESVARPLVEKIDESPHDEVAMKWELVKKGTEIRLLTRGIPSIYGGGGGTFDFFRYGTLFFLPVIEELACLSPGLATLFGAHYLGIIPIQVSMDIPLGRRLLKPICEAEKAGNPKMCAFAITEPGAGSDVEDTEGGEKAKLMTFATKVKGGYILNGRKQFISNGNMASLITVFACLDKEKKVHSWTCFAVTSDMKAELRTRWAREQVLLQN